MKQILYNYDIFPKVFLGNREKTITIQPLGDHASFKACHEYTIKVFKVDQSNPAVYPERSGRTTLTAAPEADGNLRFTAFFEGEGEHFVNVYDEPEGKPRFTLSLYSLNEDMAGRIPYRGDLHMHTCRSDGKEAPSAVCANYRGHGYDFFAITDHRRFYPSLEAIEMYKDITDFNIVPGEEVHLPLNNVHYVNFGSTFSINALVTPNCNQEKAGDDLSFRSTNGNAPDTMTEEEFIAMIEKRSEKVNREHKSERLSYAVLEWTYEQVQKGGGLGIFPHPYWLCQMMQLPEDYTEFIYKNAPFDAFEVLGGENYYPHNGFQTGLYYEMKARGIDHPVVGSTDSHGSTEHNRNALICSTIVFAHTNKTEELISAIKSKYSIAVDTISTEYRLVGDFRLMKYASFLLENYFPLHDMACKAEGYYMNRFVAGDKRAEAVLKEMKGQIPEMQKKYFEV
ncbi:MAG: PHP domain-containing protein [Ruminococcaceae bacterium]|nr:PHP domain-containing protein [Oscillospiraceae bacterium]